jgi:hypothetical protein
MKMARPVTRGEPFSELWAGSGARCVWLKLRMSQRPRQADEMG